MLHKKWCILILYLLGCVLVWINRYPIFYQHITAAHHYRLFDIMLISFLLSIFVCNLFLLRLPAIDNFRFQRAMQRCSLHNGAGEYPTLLRVYPDKSRAHGKIFKIKNNGISILDFSTPNTLARLEATLNGKIYNLEYGRRTTSILLYLMPTKFACPRTISLNSIELANEPNFLVVGKTGSGKSYSLHILLGIYASIPNVKIYICDYKKSSFLMYSDCKNFYGYEDVPNGIRAFYEEFKYRLSASDEQRNKQIRVLLIDEYGALISAQDKKVAEELKTMVANMLFMGRSLGIRVILGVQRADAEHFKAGARDQFRAILGLGNLSKEQKQMLFADYKDTMNENNGLGEGYLLIDGKDIERVQIAEIKDMEKLNLQIRKTMGVASGEA